MRYLIFCIVMACLCSCGDSSNENRVPGAENNTRDLDVCAALIECARETGTTGVTSLIALYGEEGECWSMDGVTREDCLIECAGTIAPIQAMNPGEPACRICEEDADCEPFGHQYCNAITGGCTSDQCGNGIVDGDEVCEPAFSEHCDSDCESYCMDCSPVNFEETCDAGTYCVLLYLSDMSSSGEDLGSILKTSCETMTSTGDRKYVDEGEECGSDVNAHCNPGLYCSHLSPWVCSKYCDTRFPVDCDEGQECVGIYLENTSYCNAMETFGFCR